VGGAQMPDAEELPPALRPLARRNAIEMNELRWRYDCQRLMTALDDMLGERSAAGTGVAQAPAPARARALLPLWLEGVAVALAAGLFARVLFGFLATTRFDPDTDRIVSAILLRGACWAAVGTALGIWLSLRRGDHRRLLRRTAMGLVLGALGGVLGGALYGLVTFLPAENLDADGRDQVVQIGALALTGGIVGLAIGALWIPPRVVAACLGGAVGGAAVQLATNATGHPPDPWTFGLNCFVIVGVSLLAMLTLDVRAAAATRRAVLVPDPANG
jgi:MFS family permease